MQTHAPAPVITNGRSLAEVEARCRRPLQALRRGGGRCGLAFLSANAGNGYIYSKDQLEISADRFHISTPELTFSGDRNGCAVSVKGEQVQIDLTATTAAPPLLMNGQGQFFFIDLDEQYEFAFPAMSTAGTVAIDNTAYPVTGLSWLDRQWGRLPAGRRDPPDRMLLLNRHLHRDCLRPGVCDQSLEALLSAVARLLDATEWKLDAAPGAVGVDVDLAGADLPR
jgi:hypothetical protein